MDPRYDDLTLLAPDLAAALTPDERAALDSAMAGADPVLLRALAHWAMLRRHIAREVGASLPPADLLVLYALSDDGEALEDDERARLAHAAGTVEAAIERTPALQRVIDRLRADRDAFYRMWDEPAAATLAVGRPVRRAADREPAASPRQRGIELRRWAWRSAAAVALALFVGLAVFLVQRDAGFDTVRTGAGETLVVRLPDGSEVRLAENSTLQYAMPAGAERQVRLTGEAVFDVVAAAETFVVETPVALATVLGTTFGVRADGVVTEVVLAHGRVALSPRVAPESAVELAPGERSRVVAGQFPEAPVATDVAEALAWSGTWYFQATPLGEIAERLSARYDVRIHVPERVRDERITGAFDQGVAVEQTLQTLAAALGISVEEEADNRFRFLAIGD
jgi:transmembrane sensor